MRLFNFPELLLFLDELLLESSYAIYVLRARTSFGGAEMVLLVALCPEFVPEYFIGQLATQTLSIQLYFHPQLMLMLKRVQEILNTVVVHDESNTSD